jgi:riboflavin kinase/FMN adenylyltransferase
VLAELVAEAATLTGSQGATLSTVLTFDRHPRGAGASGPRCLTDLERRIELLGEVGIEQVGVLPFEDIRSMLPAEFVKDVLVEALGARLVTVGHDFRFGRYRTGCLDTLFRAGRRFGFRVNVIEPVCGKSNLGRVSSTLIRGLVAAGDLDGAALALGRPHDLPATVETTARGPVLRFPSFSAVPGTGWYLVDMVMGGTALAAVGFVDPEREVAELRHDVDIPAGAAVRVRFRSPLGPSLPPSSGQAGRTGMSRAPLAPVGAEVAG